MGERTRGKRKTRRVDGAMKYPDYETLKEGDLIMSGIYLGPTTSKKFNTLQHEFKDDEGNHWTISGGHLNYLAEKNLEPGDWCEVFFEGMDTVPKGNFKGKEYKRFSLGLPEEDEEEVETAPLPTEEATPWEKPVEKKSKKKVAKKAASEPVEDDDSDDGMFDVAGPA